MTDTAAPLGASRANIATCRGCGRPFEVPFGRAKGMEMCDGCAVCKCGSGKPPGLCHGISRSNQKVNLVGRRR